MKRKKHLHCFNYLITLLVACCVVAGCHSAGGIKKEDFDRVTMGMNMDQVSAILGETKDKDQADGVHYTVIDSWSYREAGNHNQKAVVTFTNGRVTDKQWP